MPWRLEMLLAEPDNAHAHVGTLVMDLVDHKVSPQRAHSIRPELRTPATNCPRRREEHQNR